MPPSSLIPTTHMYTPRTIAKLQEGGDGWEHVAEEWPTFLYNEQAGWSTTDIWCGLFRGHVLIQVSHRSCLASEQQLRTIGKVALRLFRNKSAVEANRIDKLFNPNVKAKGPKDFLHRHSITKITPGMVAYAALQVTKPFYINCCTDAPHPFSHQQTYVALSSMSQWGPKDDTFNLIEFYHLIMATLSDEADRWVADMMGWWQRYVLHI